MARIPRGLHNAESGASKSHSYTFKDKWKADAEEITVGASNLQAAYQVLADRVGQSNDANYVKFAYDLKRSTQPNARSELLNERKQRAISKLREQLPAGTTVYTILKHVSSSGMLRVIDMVYVSNGEIVRLSPDQLEDAGYPHKYDSDAGGWRLGGAGMDMGFEAVYNLSSIVHGYEHGNTTSGLAKREGPYALQHRWL